MTSDQRAKANEYQRDWCKQNPERAREIARESYARHRAKRVARAQARRHERIALVMAHKTRCVRCGFDDQRALTFHHRDPAEKSFNISVEGRIVGLEKLLAEIAKCDVLCANCHLIEHCDMRLNNGLVAA